MYRVLPVSLLALAAVPAASAAIVFTRGSVLVVRDAHGVRSLGHLGTNPVWSPDGRTIAFEYGDDVYTVRSDGTRRRRLVAHAMHPAWSPDGTSLAYTSAGTNLDVWTVGSGGDGARRLTRGRGVDAMPWWSPDGRRIVYASQRWCAVRTLPLCPMQIFVMDATGAHKRRLTSSWWSNVRPRFSRDGRRLVWLRADESEDYWESVIRFVPDSHFVVWVARANGARMRRLTTPRIRAWAATFSPDGRRVLVSIERTWPTWHLAVVPLAGGPVRLLTGGDRNDLYADWR